MQRLRLFKYPIIHPEQEILLFSDTLNRRTGKAQDAPTPYFVNKLFIRSRKERMSPSGIIYVYF